VITRFDSRSSYGYVYGQAYYYGYGHDYGRADPVIAAAGGANQHRLSNAPAEEG
jgi:hypothetical protein